MLSAFSRILEVMYTDLMDVYHYTTTTNADHTIDTGRASVPSPSQVACKISFNSSDNPLDNEVVGTLVKTTMKVFCATSVDAKEGDYVVLTKQDGAGNILATYKGKLGLPAMFPTHQEIPVGVEDYA